jgi:hypothetical protein
MNVTIDSASKIIADENVRINAMQNIDSVETLNEAIIAHSIREIVGFSTTMIQHNTDKGAELNHSALVAASLVTLSRSTHTLFE